MILAEYYFLFLMEILVVLVNFAGYIGNVVAAAKMVGIFILRT